MKLFCTSRHNFLDKCLAPLSCPFLYSPCGVPFGPSITVPGLAYLFLRLSALECLNSFADCMTYFALC